MKKLLLAFLFGSVFVGFTQENLTTQLFDSYDKYHEGAFEKRRIKHSDLQPLIEKLRSNGLFEVNKVGQSIEGRDLTLVSLGTGDTNVFLWSQMHGDEPTATQAIFDIFNFFASKDFEDEKAEILKRLKLHFLPMVNPDGAERFTRRNALGVDINRDALRLQSPESRVLKRIRDSLEAKFGFNLHDQSRYYNAERTHKPATISYLATAFNYEKDINEVRANAMKVIVFMNRIIQNYAPGQVGRYSDDFEPRAFGDNIAKWGTSLILIESGGYANDREKQQIRKLNYVSILSALYAIAMESYQDIPIEAYEQIPRNDRNLFDLKLENLTYELQGNAYTIDLGINRNERDLPGHNEFYYQSEIVDQGDLSTYYGYETFDASGHTLVPPQMMPQILKKVDGKISGDWLMKGYGYLKVQNLPNVPFVNSPVNIAPVDFTLPEFRLRPGINPTFFLKKEGQLTHAIINGFLLDLKQPLEQQQFINGLILK